MELEILPQSKELFYTSKCLFFIFYILITFLTLSCFSTVEDTDTTIGEIKENFGEEVAGIVADVTDDKSLRSDMRKKHQVEHAPHINTRSKLVKLADKL